MGIVKNDGPLLPPVVKSSQVYIGSPEALKLSKRSVSCVLYALVKFHLRARVTLMYNLQNILAGGGGADLICESSIINLGAYIRIDAEIFGSKFLGITCTAIIFPLHNKWSQYELAATRALLLS